MTSTPLGSSLARSIDPADFGDPSALNLADPVLGSTVTSATEDALAALDIVARRFGIERVQFFFNGTPAVVSVGDTVEAVHGDWHERRTAYQRAAGII